MKDNIAIIGFMGSGKTTVGRLLSERTGYRFFDLDRIIELSEGRTVNDIFEKDGEDYFRDIESKIIQKITDNNRCVFACGGGIVLKGENMRLITKKCHMVYLMISHLEAGKRLSECKDRPLILGKDRNKKITDLLKKRRQLYEDYAEITVDNERLSPQEAVEAIIDRI